MKGIYTLDKLILLMRVRSSTVADLEHFFRFGVGDRYGVLEKDWLGYGISAYHENFTIKCADGDKAESWYWGVQPNRDSPNEYWTTCKLEFNPAKVGKSPQFDAFYCRLISNCKYIDFKQFDVAIDIPYSRSSVHVLMDRRNYTMKHYGGEEFTEYLGVGHAHGNVKIYNKQIESKLDYPLTRVELTMSYANCTYQEFKRLFPNVFVLDSLGDDIDGTEKVLCLSCLEHPEYVKMLGRKMRKKIETLLVKASLVLKPDEIDYKDILSQILWYGKGIPVEKFVELEDTNGVEFPEHPGFEPLGGSQEEMI